MTDDRATGPRPIAVTLGDPAGIGPEIVAKAWERRQDACLPPFFAVGDEAALRSVWAGPIHRIEHDDNVADIFPFALPLLHFDAALSCAPGQPTLDGAAMALQALELAVGLTRTGNSSAIVTGPVSKDQMAQIGFTFPGQTEFVAERCGVARDRAVMMIAGPALRVVPITVHIPLTDVPAALSTELIITKAEITARGLMRNFGIARPRLAIAGLNPHAGENGRLGQEDAAIIAPAIAALQAAGIDASGPHAADAMFASRNRAQYDAALCMYHDQALIPIKALYFDEGVNITLGLPIVRTSPDHGTAFALAGQDAADPSSMAAAIEMAGSATAHRALPLPEAG